VKYPESNLQRCKAMLVSRMVHTTIPGDMEAKKDLWRSQCNCAYWHGLFGGIYLNYLRHANYSNMLAAEVAVDRAARGVGEWVEADRLDFDHDGADEILLRSSSVNAYISPGYGGSLFELDYKPALFNLCDTLKRSEEPYHAAMLRQEGQKHGRRQLTGALCYDWYLRRSFLDHFLGPGTSPEGFARCSYPEQGGFVNQSYEIESVVPGERMISAGLRRRGVYHAPQGRRHLDIQKTYILHTNGLLEVRYCITNPHDRDDLTLWMGIELTMTLLAGNNADRYLVFGPRAGHQCLAGSRGAVEGVSSVDFVNKRDRFTARVSWDEPSRCWHFPVETVSQSEKGFDLNYQGTAVMPQFLFTLPPGGDKRISFTIGICEV
jgi:alpha-amylase